MKQEYNSFFNKVTPLLSDEELTQNLLRKEKNMGKNNKLKFRKPTAAVCAVLMVLSLSVAGAAAIHTGISFFKNRELGRNETVAEKVSVNVYQETSTHMRMTAEELLTDGRIAQILLHYEALTEEGEKWFEKNMDIYGYMSMLGGHLDSQMTYISTHLPFDLKKYRTEKDRYFCLSIETNIDRTDSFSEITLVYPMLADTLATVNRQVYTTVSEENIVDIHEYKLIGDSGSECWKAEYLSVSDLSLVIYGNGDGLTEYEPKFNRSSLSENFYKAIDEIEHTMFLIMSDGSLNTAQKA